MARKKKEEDKKTRKKKKENVQGYVFGILAVGCLILTYINIPRYINL